METMTRQRWAWARNHSTAQKKVTTPGCTICSPSTPCAARAEEASVQFTEERSHLSVVTSDRPPGWFWDSSIACLPCSCGHRPSRPRLAPGSGSGPLPPARPHPHGAPRCPAAAAGPSTCCCRRLQEGRPGPRHDAMPPGTADRVPAALGAGCRRLLKQLRFQTK